MTYIVYIIYHGHSWYPRYIRRYRELRFQPADKPQKQSQNINAQKAHPAHFELMRCGWRFGGDGQEAKCMQMGRESGYNQRQQGKTHSDRWGEKRRRGRVWMSDWYEYVVDQNKWAIVSTPSAYMAWLCKINWPYIMWSIWRSKSHKYRVQCLIRPHCLP